MASFHTTSRRTAVARSPGSWEPGRALAGLYGSVRAHRPDRRGRSVSGGRGAGRRTGGGLSVLAASALLGLFLLPDKGVALLYLIFLGLYPVVKNNIEGLRRLPLEWLCKLACFNAALSLFWFALRALFLPDPPVWLGERTWLLYLAGNLIFVLYDVGLSRLIALVMARMPGRRR